MKTNAVLVGTVLVLFVSACAPQAAPTSVSQDVQNTAVIATVTQTAQTMVTVPSSTPAPPTATVTSIPNLIADTGKATATSILPAITETSIPQQSPEPTGDPCDKLLTSWEGPTAHFSIYNETKPEGRIVLSLYVVTPLGECGSLADLSSGPAGSYSARAYVDGKTRFKVFGEFQIKEGSWKIVVRNDKIIALGSCYPSC